MPVPGPREAALLQPVDNCRLLLIIIDIVDIIYKYLYRYCRYLAIPERGHGVQVDIQLAVVAAVQHGTAL